MWLILIGLYKSEVVLQFHSHKVLYCTLFYHIYHLHNSRFVRLFLTVRFVIAVIIAVMTHSTAETHAYCKPNRYPQTDIFCCNSDCGSDCNSYTHTNRKTGFVIVFLVVLVIIIHKSTSLYPDLFDFFKEFFGVTHAAHSVTAVKISTDAVRIILGEHRSADHYFNVGTFLI